jgi:fatty acid desaturase
MAILVVNYNRTVVAHHYRSRGDVMTYHEQLADSVNITGSRFLTELFFPLGLRYHALHHMFPAIPYHNLGKAHRRLMAELPADALYRQTVYPNYWAALAALIDDVRRAGRGGSTHDQGKSGSLAY